MITSPLRYPGGKAKLFPFFCELFKRNNLFSKEYCEPYAGGAGLALKLLTGGFVENISINDIDAGIVCFWKAALYQTSSFCSLIDKAPLNIDEWHRQKAIWNCGNKRDVLALGFATYYLNRTNRSGIIEGAGPIGGFNQISPWKIDARFVKGSQISNILALSKFADQIQVSGLDALKYSAEKFRGGRSFLYLDPPYYIKGRKLYKNFYVHKDHESIRDLLGNNKQHSWICTYDDVQATRELYSSFSSLGYALSYSAGEKLTGREIMIFSSQIDPPNYRGFVETSAE